MKLIVAEKPLVSKAIAKVLGANTSKDGYLENSQYQVSWAFGHLVELSDPEDYDPELKRWSADSLPILPSRFSYRVKQDPGARKQFKRLKDLMNSASEIICATDNDREGDLIFHYIYMLSGSKTPYMRILPNDLSVNGIKKALSKPVAPRTDIIKSAQCRSQSDWLVGINASRAITVSSQQNISIGRVQTPTLALVCKRYLENKNFQKTAYYPVTITLTKSEISFTAKIKDNPKTEAEAKQISQSLSDSSRCVLSEKKQVEEKQPLPYYLSTLQMDANKKFGFSAQQTLNLAQSLYEKHKITTYPRTDSGYLTTDLFNQISPLLSEVLKLYEASAYQNVINFNSLPTTCVNDKKAPNHHGIIPTSDLSSYSQLNDQERKLFDLIAKRFLAAFSPVCIKDKTHYEFENQSITFETRGSVTVSQGWRTFTTKESEESEDQTETQNLPAVSKDDVLPTSNIDYQEKYTKPPALLTQATLIQAMKSCGSKLDDEQMRKAMQDNELRTGGLATEATRAATIQRLLNISLIAEQKKHLIPTDMGLSLYQQIKDLDISKPDLTAQWELALDQIAQGKTEPEKFIDAIKKYTHKVTNDMLEVGGKVDTDNLKLTCPKCEKGKIVEGKKGYGCSRWKDDQAPCDLVIWKSSYGKTITPTILQQLLSDGRTKGRVKGLKHPSIENSFEAYLVLTEDFKVKAQQSNGETFKCPQCQGDVAINNAGAFCKNEDLKIFRKVAQKQLTDTQIKQLLTKGVTGKIKGFKSAKTGKNFEAKVKLVGGKTEFDFS